MKTLNYKNIFQSLFSLIFNRKQFQQRLYSLIEKEKSELKNSLEEGFEEKILFLLNKESRTITNREFQIPVMQMPITDPKRHPCYFDYNYKTEEKNIERLHFSISDSRFSSIDIKKMAARQISEHLINGNFIKAQSHGNEIQFYIQYF